MGVFIGAKGTGGQGTNPGPKRRARHGRMAAETRSCARAAAIQWPRERRFEPRAVPSVPCQALCPVLVLQPLVLTNQLL